MLNLIVWYFFILLERKQSTFVNSRGLVTLFNFCRMFAPTFTNHMNGVITTEWSFRSKGRIV